MTIRVGLVVYGLDRPLTGIGRYTLELARALMDCHDEMEFVLLAAGGLGPLAIEGGFRQQHLPGCRLLPGLITLGNLAIRQAALDWDLDIVHDPTGVTPFLFGIGNAAGVVTIHDVFTWSLPGYSSPLDTLIYRHWLPYILPRRAQQVITISNHSKREIQKYLHVPAERLQVIPYGVASRFQPEAGSYARQYLHERFGLSSSYLLYVGALTLRKNIESALRAFALIAADFPGHRFVVAGPRTWKQTPIEDTIGTLGIADKILLTGPLTDADLPALYADADLFVFPSLYEGFGLPPLEAMACGVPVVCSDAASLPEVVGDAALTVDPYDVEGLAGAIRRVLGDAALRHELRERGLARARGFTWERTAQKTMALYRTVLD